MRLELDRASANLLSFPAQCSIVNENSSRRQDHRASLNFSSFIFLSQVNAVLSVLSVKCLSSNYERYLFIPQITARHSCSVQWYLDSVGLNFALVLEIMNFFFSLSSWKRTVPIPLARTSVCRINGGWGLGRLRAKGFFIKALIFLNVSWATAVHLKGLDTARRSVKGAAVIAKCGMYSRSHLQVSWKLRNSLRVRGGFASRIACMCSGCAWFPSLVTMWPSYSSFVFPKWHFFGLQESPYITRCSRMKAKWLKCSSSVDE